MAPPFKVLVFHRSATYQHASTPAAVSAIRLLGICHSCVPSRDGGGMRSQLRVLFSVISSDDASECITAESLAQYAVVVFVNNCGDDVLDEPQLAALREFVEVRGGGFVGVHAASAAMAGGMGEGARWYSQRLIGAGFKEHPAPQVGRVSVATGVDCENAKTRARIRLTRSWTESPKALTDESGRQSHEWMDEWYNYHSFARLASNAAVDEKVDVLLTVDESGYEGGKMELEEGKLHPVAWFQEHVGGEQGGRSLYIQLGHFEEAWSDNRLLKMVREGIMWTAHADSASE